MAERLRIAQVAPLAMPVVRDARGSIEQLVWLLTEELVRRGHEVTLFATGDSETSANLHAAYPHSYREDYKLWDSWEYHELMHLASAFERAHEFDVIHSHVYHFAPPLARLVDKPVLHTDHVPQSESVRDCYARYPETNIVALSRYHREKFEGMEDVPIIYNGIDTESFPFGEEPGDYLVFLGNLVERKGVVEAIRAAREAGMRLILAGKGGGEYYESIVEPLIDGESVEHVGRVDVEERNELLSGAAAMLFTSLRAEPFGLVMVEAMACGTPVVALERCAVPEIVDRGATGYYVEEADSLASIVPKTVALDRAHCREQAQKRFDYRRMADEYETLYRRLAGKEVHGPRELV
ncbi:MAG: glycosyltransferase family 4 protein [Rubrobacteraceae bacterium]